MGTGSCPEAPHHHSAGDAVGRVWPPPRGCSLIFTQTPFLCLLLTEERRSLPPRLWLSVLATRSRKTRDSVNISIPLC